MELYFFPLLFHVILKIGKETLNLQKKTLEKFLTDFFPFISVHLVKTKNMYFYRKNCKDDTLWKNMSY